MFLKKSTILVIARNAVMYERKYNICASFYLSKNYFFLRSEAIKTPTLRHLSYHIGRTMILSGGCLQQGGTLRYYDRGKVIQI